MTDSNPSTHWFVYIIEADDGKLYTGITTDVERRFCEHSEGKIGARFFRTAKPLRIVWQEQHPNRSSATRKEMTIKKMTRLQKIYLLEESKETP